MKLLIIIVSSEARPTDTELKATAPVRCNYRKFFVVVKKGLFGRGEVFEEAFCGGNRDEVV